MDSELKIGVYVCHCGINIASTVDVEAVVEFARGLPSVAVARNYTFVCSDPGQAMIRDDIREFGLNRVVVAACSPRMHELTFRGNVFKAGLNPYLFEMTNIREQCAWVHDDREQATRKAKALVAGSVARAALLEPLEEKEASVTPSVLVLGGGIAGIQAALDVAAAGFQVHLVEREPSIGGHMAQLDKTFPTLDCSACILMPKMVDAASHPNIDLLTYSELIAVEGSVGRFKVKVRKKPRYVDTAKCTACGLCAEACVQKGRIPNVFDAGMAKRSAVYLPFAQAVPAKYTVDPEHCIFLRKGKCGPAPRCREACPSGAIDFDQKEEIVELEVGTIVVATGFDPFDPTLKPEYAYGQYDNVITGLEFERLASASGPTAGKILINGKTPQKVVFIQCVGSRDKSVGNPYCSRVCCLYAAKQAHLIREKLPHAKVTVCYIDMRAFGKGFEEFYDRVLEEGVVYLRGNASEVYRKGETLRVKAEDTLLGELVELEADLVVLSAGLTARADAKDVAGLLKIPQGADRFFLEAHPKLRPVDTVTEGIFLAGCCQGPKDIPDTVAQAKAAASSAMIPLVLGKVKIAPTISTVIDANCDGCAYCIDPCPFKALTLIEYMRNGEIKKTVETNEALCKGCGVCQATCPKRGIFVKHYTIDQIEALVAAAMQP